MPKRLLLEGTDIEELLTQVRNEHGPDVSIVSADRVRTGGFAGFFARQRYELTVEVNDEPVRPAAPAQGSAVPAAVPVQAPTAAPASVQSSADPVAALLARAEEQERQLGASGSRPAVPAQGSVAAPVSVPAASPSLGQALGSPAFTAPSGTAQAVPSRVPAAAAGDFVVEPGAESLAFADMLSALQRDGSATRSGALVARAYQPPAVVEEQPATGMARSFHAPVIEQQRPFVRGLIELGMPEGMARKATETDMYGAVKSALADLPDAPGLPGNPGDVLVIVGETHSALRLAKKAARILNIGPGQILLAARSTAGTDIHTSRRLSGPRAAAQKARKIHRDDVPYVVVVASTPEERNGEWAGAVADALGATAVWAVVDATRKTADTARHLRSLGKVDAVAVTAVEATGDPASVLHLDLPVSYLDDRPSNRQAWTALLCERLEEMQS
ncbi:hypothetical protein GCM10010156_51250 [Planobispora rosea]|uniref:Uncharacterized protein n=1 Tax=Planobispora rosea TaxID=35762 RepID=A0A8J3SC32_PLARO|nr:hypothetical protein [Planobispora rosea]GGS86467.1 hypothetical protein GCM10010156_51250 [Planobispora rosea]GIH89049.1 hypothetical protein Pro02_74570 [Planobispora rosea]